jgi:RNA-directed DNA polymerase
MSALKRRVSEYGISLNEEKTRTLKLNKQSYRGKQSSRKILKIKTEKGKLKRAIEDFYSWIKENRNRRKLKELWSLARAKITGHVNYYGYWMNNLKVQHFYSEAWKSLYKWLNRRSQKRSYTVEGFSERVRNFPLMESPDKIKWKSLGRSFGRI